MKQLNDILAKVRILRQEGPENPVIRSIGFDSRRLEKGSAFFAIPGTVVDGHDFIDAALEAGAHVIICEELPSERKAHVCYVKVVDSAEALGLAASSFFNDPSDNLRVVGITGTNGKTTIATLLHRVFTETGQTSGLISTIRYLIGSTETLASHTTPDPIQLNRLFDEMIQAGCRYCFMEISSHAIHQKRTAGIRFAGGIFSNISHEHLDYHKTFKEYLQTKKSFFDSLPRDAFALFNRDDRNGRVMVQNCGANVISYGLKGPADIKGKVLESHLDGMQLQVDGRELWSRLIGQFNASNILAVYACGLQCGMDADIILTILSRQTAVRGRFETLQSDDGITAIVDYAHTPDALEKVLSTIAGVRNGKSQLITVVGAGGNRDTGKRPKMGKVASEFSHKLILTSDNPRDEKPEEIIRQMMNGVPEERQRGILSIPDRREAIKTAVMLASWGDVILIAGKGHESYQEIEGKRYHFDDMEVLREFLKTS